MVTFAIPAVCSSRKEPIRNSRRYYDQITTINMFQVFKSQDNHVVSLLGTFEPKRLFSVYLGTVNTSFVVDCFVCSAIERFSFFKSPRAYSCTIKGTFIYRSPRAAYRVHAKGWRCLHLVSSKQKRTRRAKSMQNSRRRTAN
jgi:hypothetical protein